ncbi:phage baseplate assembly protein domain-containing protein [Methylolobus aquaticus]
MTVRRGVIDRVVDDAGKAQRVQVHGVARQLLDQIEHMQPYGYTAHPLPIDSDGKGAECLLLDIGGTTYRIVAVASDRRSRPRTCAEGDVVIYTAADDPDAEHADAVSRIALTLGPALFVRIGAARITANQEHLKLQYGGATITMTAGQIHFTAGG